MAIDILCLDCDNRRHESGKKYGSFLSLSWQWASDTCSSHLHTVHNFRFSLMESSINHPWSTLLDAATCTLVVNYWCYALPVQQCIQDLK